MTSTVSSTSEWSSSPTTSGGGFMQISGNSASLCLMSLNELMRSMLYSSFLSYENATIQSQSASKAAEHTFDLTLQSAQESFNAAMIDASSKLTSGAANLVGAAATTYYNKEDMKVNEIEAAKAQPYRTNEEILTTVNQQPSISDAGVKKATTTTPFEGQCKQDLLNHGRIQSNTLETDASFKNLDAKGKQDFEETQTKASMESMTQAERDTTARQIKAEKEPHESRIDRSSQNMSSRTTQYNMVVTSATSILSSGFSMGQAVCNKESAIDSGLSKLQENSQSQLNSLASQWTSAASDRFQSAVKMTDYIDALVRACALS